MAGATQHQSADTPGRLLQSGLHRSTVAKVYRVFRTMMDTATDDALVWTAATSGPRFGELTGLTRHHVGLGPRSIRVEQVLAPERGKGPVLTAPKSVAAYRTVAVPQRQPTSSMCTWPSTRPMGATLLCSPRSKAVPCSAATSPSPGKTLCARPASKKAFGSTTCATWPPYQRQPLAHH